MTTIKERFDEILSKPMNRQQFLKQAGLLVLAVVGVTSLLNVLDPKHSQKSLGHESGDAAYGGSVYAGKKSVS